MLYDIFQHVPPLLSCTPKILQEMLKLLQDDWAFWPNMVFHLSPFFLLFVFSFCLESRVATVSVAFCLVRAQIRRVSAWFPRGANPHTACARQPLVGIVCTLKRVNSCYKTETIYVRPKRFYRPSSGPAFG